MAEKIVFYYLLVSIIFLIVATLFSKMLMKKYFCTDPKWQLRIEKQARIGIGLMLLTSMLLGLFVSPYFFVFSMFMSTGLIFAGVTNFCGISIIIGKMPWNKFDGDK